MTFYVTTKNCCHEIVVHEPERFYLLKYSGVDPFKNGFITINHTYIMYAKRYDFYQNSGFFLKNFLIFLGGRGMCCIAAHREITNGFVRS